MSEPIWKDHFVGLGVSSPLPFRIKVGDDVIYSGKSYIRPGEDTNEIRINDICADWLQNVLPSLSHAEFSALDSLTFVTEVYLNNAWTQKDSVEFINDWSYDYGFDPAVQGLSFPVTRRLDARQWLIFSAYDADIVTAKINLRNGESINVYISTLVLNDFNLDYNDDFAKALRGSKNGTALLDLNNYDAESVEINGEIFEILPSCNRYALYYANAYGGWDSLLIEGNVQERDNLTRHQRELEYDNRSITNRGADNYLNEISKIFTLHTSWLSDEQSLRMHHLLNSTNVFLFDAEKQQMIPVILQNTSTEYKTYKSNGRSLINYEIEVAVAQERIRR